MATPSGSSKSTLSPSELAQLEHAFAADPSSDAYRPLAEAYLSMGRYMEAMVVCKKGVKAHPETSTARVLLARVYADQGKDKKALEELQGALQVTPADVAALRMAGSLMCKTGDLPGGAEHLKKAFNLDPHDAETAEACAKYNVAVTPPPPPEPPAPVAVVAPPVVSAPVLQQQQPRQVPTLQPQFGQPLQPQNQLQAPPVLAPPAQPLTNGHATHEPQHDAPTQAKPKPVRRKPPPAPAVRYEDLAAKYGEPGDEAPRRKGAGLAGLLVTLLIMIGGAGALGGYYWHAKTVADRERKIERLLKQVQEELTHDSFAGYKKACEYGESIVDLDPTLFSAHAYLAYAYALRWGEHGEGELAEKNAREHLARAKAAKTEHSHIVASEAYIKFFSGQGQEAQSDLEKFTEAKKSSGPLVTSTLGILQMHAGDLDHALKSLKAAQQLAPADARINSAVGNVLRRMGNEFLAANAYETALRYEKGHAEAQLGVALMAIDNGKIATADDFVKRLISADPPPSSRQMALARIAHAIVLDEQGKSADAEKEQTLAFEADSKNAELYIMKSRRLLKAGKVDEAVKAIREAIAMDPRRASFYVDLAKALVRKDGGAKEAVTSLQQALKTMPGSPKLLVLLGDAYRAADDNESARGSYEKALTEAKDKLPEARLALADLARTKKDYPRASELYEKAISEYMTSPDRQAYAYTEMGRMAEEQGDAKKALDAYKSAAKVDPTFANSYYFIGKMFVSDKDKAKRERAVEIFQTYLNLAPNGQYAAEVSRLVPAAKK